MTRRLPLALLLLAAASCSGEEPRPSPNHVAADIASEQRILAVAMQNPWAVEDETFAPPTGRSSGPASGAEPFSPGPAPDHVVVMDSIGAGDGARRTVRRHGDWVLVNDLHVSLSRTTTVRFERDPRGGYRRIWLWAGVSEAMPSGGRRTGETRRIAGETCAVWALGGRGRSCLTRDGIELWRTDGHREYRAVSIRREPVPPSVTAPPDDLLDPALWPLSAPAVGASSVEAILSSGLGPPPPWKGRRYRRVGSIERVDDRSGVMIRDRATGAYASFLREEDGRYRSLIVQGPSPEEVEAKPRSDRAALRLHGETCRWRHMTPGLFDAATYACLTEDGVPLRVTSTSWGHITAELAATSITRGRLAPQDVAAPAAVLLPENWGLPASRR